jgi:hypothetical protein
MAQLEQTQAFGKELAAQFGATVDPRYARHHWAFGFEIEPGINLFADLSKPVARYSLSAEAVRGERKTFATDCGVNVSRGASAAAKVIRAKLLNDVLPMVREVLAQETQRNLDKIALTAQIANFKKVQRGAKVHDVDNLGRASFIMYTKHDGELSARLEGHLSLGAANMPVVRLTNARILSDETSAKIWAALTA